MVNILIQDYLIQIIISAVLLLYPTWRIYKKAGLNPFVSFTVLIPIIGLFVSALILISSKWNIKSKEVIQ